MLKQHTLILTCIDTISSGLQLLKSQISSQKMGMEFIHQELKQLVVTNFEMINLDLNSEQNIKDAMKYQEQIEGLEEKLQEQAEKKGPEDGNLTMEISDLYESMPDQFTEKIPKSHFNLIELMEFYDIVIANKNNIKNQHGIYKHWKDLFAQADSIKCPYCFQKQVGIKRSKEHAQIYHYGGQQKCPYKSLFRTFDCIIGCQFKGQNISELRQHLIIYHKTKELEMWGISRQYLKFQQNLISLDKVDIAARSTQHLGQKVMVPDSSETVGQKRPHSNTSETEEEMEQIQKRRLIKKMKDQTFYQSTDKIHLYHTQKKGDKKRSLFQHQDALSSNEGQRQQSLKSSEEGNFENQENQKD